MALDHDWTPSDLYNKQNYKSLERLHWLRDKEYIDSAEKEMDENAIKEFKVTKLPAGSPNDYETWKPDPNLSGIGKSTKSLSEEKRQELAEQKAQAKERKILKGELPEEE